MTASLLAVDKLEVVYKRAITAVQGVSLRVPRGQIVALLGSLAEVVNEVGEKTYVNVVDDKSVMVLAD